MDATLERELLAEVKRLPAAQQKQVLHFARSLAVPTRADDSRAVLLALAGTISSGDAAEMRAAIEEGCERVDEEQW